VSWGRVLVATMILIEQTVKKKSTRSKGQFRDFGKGEKTIWPIRFAKNEGRSSTFGLEIRKSPVNYCPRKRIKKEGGKDYCKIYERFLFEGGKKER